MAGAGSFFGKYKEESILTLAAVLILFTIIESAEAAGEKDVVDKTTIAEAAKANIDLTLNTEQMYP